MGLVIGRFQPFHLGHKYLIEEALKVCDKIIIGIGSSNVSDKSNPYSFEQRERFLREFVNNEKLDNKVLNIVPIVDDPDDNVWFEILIKNTGKFDVGVGDNDWVNGILEENKIPVVRVGFYDRKKLEGTEIRKLMKGNKKKWEDRVPSYLVSQLTK
jgi:nicotinamide-nucleotide adenylyltransferase